MYCVPSLIFLLLPTLLFCCSDLVLSPLCCIPFSLPRTAPFRFCLSGFRDFLTLSWLTYSEVVVRDVQRHSQRIERTFLSVSTP